jgi:hypothetical protein
MIAGDCQWTDEVARLLKASVAWRANLRSGHLSATDAWYALYHTINRTIQYPMMATYLTKVECEKIMCPFLNAGLSASGVVWTMLRAVVWGPVRYQGLGIRHLYTTQGIEHLLAILRHATIPTLTGKLLQTTIEEMQLEIGVSEFILSYSFADYGVIATRSWISATSKFLSESRIKVIDPFPKPQQASRTDRFLMEAFFACGYRGVELRNLNNCRLHLHALQISDICTADGRHLTQALMEVQLDQQRLSLFTWPCTHRPKFGIRFFWRSALTKTLLCSTLYRFPSPRPSPWLLFAVCF